MVGLSSTVPLPFNSFIGRAEELQTVQTLLATHRLVTLTGAAGIGKRGQPSRIEGYEGGVRSAVRFRRRIRAHLERCQGPRCLAPARFAGEGTRENGDRGPGSELCRLMQAR
jgi:hypothetical protein